MTTKYILALFISISVVYGYHWLLTRMGGGEGELFHDPESGNQHRAGDSEKEHAKEKELHTADRNGSHFS